MSVDRLGTTRMKQLLEAESVTMNQVAMKAGSYDSRKSLRGE